MSTLRRMTLSPPARPIAVAAMVSDWGEIILPTTPPAAPEPTSSARIGSTPMVEPMPICCPTLDCRLLNRMTADVSEPVT